MSLQSNLIRRGTESSARRRLDLEKEDDIIRIPDCDMNAVTERFKKTLIGRVLHLGGRSVDAMIGFLPRARIWNVEGRVRGVNLGNGRFQFDFDKEEDLTMVLNKRPCHFNHWTFALERWEPFTNENFPNTIPFWIKVTGVPVHYWNEDTFGEIAKALGKMVAIDAKNARIQVSIDADKPLHFERRVGFPNGDIGKVYFSYEGLDRHCFACKRISHDIYSCSEISQEERESKIKEYRDTNPAGPSSQQGLLGFPVNNRYNNGSSKRPRSPIAGKYPRSPNRDLSPGNSREVKRTKATENYWTAKAKKDNGKPELRSDWRRNEKHDQNRYTTRKEDVWSRLDNQTAKKPEDYKPRNEQSKQGRQQRHERHTSRNQRSPQTSHQSQQVWRPRTQMIAEKSIDHSRTATNPNHLRISPSERADSQQTISGAISGRIGKGGQGNGVLVVHQNETSAERMRRLKGKAHLTTEPQEMISPLAVILKDRGTLSIREGENRPPIAPSRYASSLLRTDFRKEDPSLELDKLMVSEQVEDMVLTREEETEVDKLVDEFGEVAMDENMIQNDDLLVDEPDCDAEIIEAISQLNPANAEGLKKHKEAIQQVPEDCITPGSLDKELRKSNQAQGKKKSMGNDRNLQSGKQNGNGRGTDTKRKIPRSPDLKGARASKKLNSIRGRPSPKNQKSSGTSSKPVSLIVPRCEVYPSAKSTISFAVPGSVGSQKPPSKKI
ncbi:hypothetical protein N665_0502s0001 [Sinapis alba]|nr:hypothetical protein N665_0502s0001 [Sinapis alba]